MKRIALLGAGGHGKVVADAALRSGWRHVDFFDDAWPNRDKNGPWPVVGNCSALLERLSDYEGVLVSLGDCRARWERQVEFEAAGARLATVIHPSATVSDHAFVGAGTVVMAGAVVQVGASIGSACIVNTGATVDHDCILEAAVHIAPGANLAGNVTVGHGSWIGIGAAVKQGIAIGSGVLIGAGAVVVQSVPDDQTLIGNPARVTAHPNT